MKMFKPYLDKKGQKKQGYNYLLGYCDSWTYSSQGEQAETPNVICKVNNVTRRCG